MLHLDHSIPSPLGKHSSSDQQSLPPKRQKITTSDEFCGILHVLYLKNYNQCTLMNYMVYVYVPYNSYVITLILVIL